MPRTKETMEFEGVDLTEEAGQVNSISWQKYVAS